ncbi:MAG: pirin family protein [Candidatus Bathyarchaeia archaeon]
MKAREVPEGAGAAVRRVFPTVEQQPMDPFVLLDEFSIKPPAGFPEHPHRGFEIVTYMLKGGFMHRDSMGNKLTVRDGGVQRITTGRGIIHAEMPASGEVNYGLQLWINLPRKLKQIEPDYQVVEGETLPIRHQEGALVRTIIGEDSPVQLRTPVKYLDVTLDAGCSFTYDLPADFKTLIYLLSGSGKACGEGPWEAGTLLVLGGDGSVHACAESQLRFVLLAGKPWLEPIRLHGPFVD